MASPIRAVLFDKDGTLVDFGATWLPAYESIVREVFGADEALIDTLLLAGGYDRRRKTIEPQSVLAAGTNEQIAALWASLTGRQDVAALIDQVNQCFIDHADTVMVPVTDLPELFGRLRARGLRIGIATNDSARALHRQMRQLGIEALVDFACGFDSGHGGKPGPGMVEAFGRSVGVAPAHIAVIGDSLHDLHMARAAGAGLAVGVLTGASPREILAAHADHVIDSIAGLYELLLSAAEGAT